ncbi:MAG: DUF1579 domain-containing protein [Phycisphaerales bacterium]
MKCCTVYGVVVGAVLGAGVVGLTTTTWGEQQDAHGKGKAPALDGKKPEVMPDDAAMMAEMARLAQPGEQHKAIAKFQGTWHGKVSHFMAPGQPPMISEGTMVNTMVLDGRWLRQEWTGDMMGQPFKGLGYWGYDTAKKEYAGMWVDTMSTSWSIFKGQFDAATKTYTSTGTMDSPMGPMNMREVVTVTDDTHHTFDMYMPGPDGKEVKAMSIEYTKK